MRGWAPTFPADDGDPVVLAAGGGVGGEELGEGGSEGEVADAGCDEAPDHGGGAAGGEGEGEGSGEGGPRVEDCEAEAQHGEGGEGAVELAAVTKGGELVVVAVGLGRLGLLHGGGVHACRVVLHFEGIGGVGLGYKMEGDNGADVKC